MVFAWQSLPCNRVTNPRVFLLNSMSSSVGKRKIPLSAAEKYSVSSSRKRLARHQTSGVLNGEAAREMQRSSFMNDETPASVTSQKILKVIGPSKFMGFEPTVPPEELLRDDEFLAELETWKEKLKERQLEVVVVWAADDPLLLRGSSGTFYFETRGHIYDLGKSVEELRQYLTSNGKSFHTHRIK